MNHILLLVVIVLALLSFERIGIMSLCCSEKGRSWIGQTYFMHPNVISTMRIPMGILSTCLWHWGIVHHNIIILQVALVWFAGWMISDLTDGTIARRCQLWTPKGEWLDPLSDKFMYFPVMLYFALVPGVGSTGETNVVYLSVPLIVGILLFDTFGQVSRLWFKKKAANTFGKAKTALITTMLTLVALLQVLYMSGENLPDFIKLDPISLFYYLSLCCFILSFLSVYCKVIPDNWYANSLTLANFCCGIGGIGQCVLAWQDPDRAYIFLFKAFLLVFFGQFFDLFDGRLARKYGSTRLGAFFDDVADGTNFGLAIGAIILVSSYLILKAANLSNTCAFYLALLLFIFYCSCVIFRLYRFLFPTRPTIPGTFQGLPSPAGAMLAGSGALLFSAELFHVRGSAWLGIIIVIIASVMMISNLPYKHFGQRILPSLPRGVQILFFLLIIIFASLSLSITKNHQMPHQLAFVCFSFMVILFYLFYGIDYSILLGKKDKTQKD